MFAFSDDDDASIISMVAVGCSTPPATDAAGDSRVVTSPNSGVVAEDAIAALLLMALILLLGLTFDGIGVVETFPCVWLPLIDTGIFKPVLF